MSRRWYSRCVGGTAASGTSMPGCCPCRIPRGDNSPPNPCFSGSRSLTTSGRVAISLGNRVAMRSVAKPLSLARSRIKRTIVASSGGLSDAGRWRRAVRQTPLLRARKIAIGRLVEHDMRYQAVSHCPRKRLLSSCQARASSKFIQPSAVMPASSSIGRDTVFPKELCNLRDHWHGVWPALSRALIAQEKLVIISIELM